MTLLVSSKAIFHFSLCPELQFGSDFWIPGEEDLYRAIETARSFSAYAPRASASLAVAKAVLETKN